MNSSTPSALLDHVPELGDGLSGEDLENARRTLVVPSVEMEPGPWDPAAITSRPVLGLLVCEGLLTRTIALNERPTTELLGPGDVLRPWDADSEGGPLRFSITWTVHERVRLAMLDHRVTTAVGRWPQVGAALSRRSVARSHSLLTQLACANLPRLDERLLVLFWHLAERWGKVGTKGTLVPLELTHHTLAELAGARRPSVTAALGELSRRELVARTSQGWLLRGDPSRPLVGLATAAPGPAASASAG